jgi:hypothetical protein
VELEQKRQDFERRGYGVAAISYDSAELLKNFAGRKGIHYPLLSDADSKAIEAFGIRNTNVPKDSMANGVPFPGTFVVDARGTVLAKYFEDDHVDRFTVAGILVRTLGEPASGQSEIEARHIRLRLQASDAIVRAGNRLVLSIEADLPDRMHVYAPGVEGGYIPIDWKMEETKDWFSHPAAFPDSEKLHLAAIGETVPVYQGKFRLLRDITIGQLRGAARDLEIRGTFRYQACDDKVCYPPENVPLKWTLRLEPLDSQRVPAELQRK